MPSPKGSANGMTSLSPPRLEPRGIDTEYHGEVRESVLREHSPGATACGSHEQLWAKKFGGSSIDRMAKTTKTAPKVPRVPMLGDRVIPEGSKAVYEITRVNREGERK